MEMWFRNILLLFIISVSVSDSLFGQQTPVKKDLTRPYGNNESYSKRSGFTKFMYRLFFKPLVPDSTKKRANRKLYKKLIQKPYSAFEGKTIRYINIVTLDPFGNSIGDTIKASPTLLSKSGNRLHIKTHPITIQNLLLIRQNQPFDSLLVKESERLVRSREYLRDVSFFVESVPGRSDSVDIFIRALDIWSINPKVSTSKSGTSVNLTDNNFLGLGHELQNIYTRNTYDKSNAFSTNYLIPNIRNTFISTTLHYNFLGHENFNRSLSIDRPFFSPFAKWAAGAWFIKQSLNDSIRITNGLLLPQRIKFNAQDYWAGSAVQLFRGNSEYNRTTKFISAVRFLRVRYLEKPGETDNEHRFSDEDLYLGSIGISTRNYVQDKYIFKFGITEVVPVGKAFSITGGYQNLSNSSRLYLGGRLSTGNYFPWGYLGSNYEYGTFFRKSRAEQGVFSVGVIYFTGLVELGKWKFRQFVKPQLTIGLNRFSYDSLTLNEGYGLDGFYSAALSGTRRVVFTLQTQSYAPWNFIGFRFGPFISFSLGLLGNAGSGFNESKVYSQIGLGVLIKNESLVLNTFQVSIAFYPTIPGTGRNIFRINSFKSGDFGLRDFEIGKPAVVLFQ